MTRKDFRNLISIISRTPQVSITAKERVLNELCESLAASERGFDQVKFRAAFQASLAAERTMKEMG